jgi:uncharacterized 2Fe-2S/4Fe-4S cluster protein (DUF4445 family)
MPTVTFHPAGRSATVPVGASLLDAAAAAGVILTAPCGGEGVCGECRARVTSGTVERVARGGLSPEEITQGWVLACSSRVIGDAGIEVPAEKPVGPAQIITAGVEPASGRAAGGRAATGEPRIVKRAMKVPAPVLGQSQSDLDRLAHAVRGSGGPGTLVAGLDTLRELAAALRESDGHVTVSITPPDSDGCAEVVRIEPGDATGCQVGLAIDVGTTTCAVSLVDLVRQHVLGTAADYNGQLARGADVISRINFARTPERLAELRGLVLNTINGLIGDLCAHHAVEPTQIDNAAMAGNTTMIHLLLGLNPDFIRLEPYTPTVNRTPPLRGGDVGLTMNPAGLVLFAPGVGSYVGGDITAGLLSTALARPNEDVRLFLDIGTNGEVVVGNGEWLMACAASAGPAFEGSGVRCGMRASHGAIERVRIDAATGNVVINVIGGGRPTGICGSGMIDLLAELWEAGLLDPAGKLNPAAGSDRIGPAPGGGRNLACTVVPAENSKTGAAISLDERDIQNLLRTKAAVYSACAIMLKSVGLDFDAIKEVCVAGGFGRFLDLEKSIRIGLLPDLPLERFTYLGNSALSGATAMLCHPQARECVNEIARRITYLELNVDPAYMSEYTAALFLPHTDLNRFPTVKAALAARSCRSVGPPWPT